MLILQGNRFVTSHIDVSVTTHAGQYLRHAHASRIAVELRGTESELMLQVEDDGTGLPTERPAGGMGLRTMAYRAQVLGGELTVAPAPGGGARVRCRVPRLAGAPAAQQRPGDQRWIPTG